MMDKVCEELDVEMERVGSLTVALYDSQLPLLEELAKRSKENGVEVKILSAEETLKLEPHINPNVKGSLLEAAQSVYLLYQRPAGRHP